MKKILIISPHYPPSNLAAVHRSRLFAQHLPSFGWEPIILAVHEDYYEETLDWNLHKLIPEGQRVEKVKAFKVTKPRLIGDIGLRGFFQLRKKAVEIIQQEKIDFVYIPIPSFYVSLIGPYVYKKTGVKYGIDYIDPWVHTFPGSDKIFSRHWFSTKIAKFLEPIAIRKAALITGVADGYYKGVIERNQYLLKTCFFGAMPYGGEKRDHDEVSKLNIAPYLFEKKENKMQLVYAGAMLPKAYLPLEKIFESIAQNLILFEGLEFHFIGTGSRPNDYESYNIKPLAEKYGLWQSIVFEYPKRIPYLDVLIHLEKSDAVFILGSTEPHYTPSKVYQGVLSQKPIFAILHKDSSAARVIETANAGLVFTFDGEQGVDFIAREFTTSYNNFKHFVANFTPSSVDKKIFENYSAKEITKQLVSLLDKLT